MNVNIKIPKFKNPQLLKLALTHRSAVNENKLKSHNERIEYLGDAVLELIISDYLYKRYPNKPEGYLTKHRTALVRTATLAEIAVSLGIPELLVVSRGERNANGHHNPTLLANTFEAVVGAVYLDQGWEAVGEFIKQVLISRVDTLLNKALDLDAKSIYQEKVQAEGKPTPTYKVFKTSGPDHNRVFATAVYVGGKITGKGSGSSKQEAEQAAAREALEKS